MKAFVRALAIQVVIVLMVSGLLHAGYVPDTGQTTFYDNAQQISAPLQGDDFYGQDASYTINPPSYTKLDANGSELPDDAAAWAMVRDNVTGLIWEIKTDDGTVHDKNNTYNWYDSNPDTNGGYAGNPGDGTDTEDFINALNGDTFGGFSDWRLPAINELNFISAGVRAGFFGPTMSEYWSSTSLQGNSQNAWSVEFSDFSTNPHGSKANSRYVFAVRGNSGESGSPRLIDNKDGTVTDIDHGLMWVQQPAASTSTWSQALSSCEGLLTAGYDDWRLPSSNELNSIIDHKRSYPALNSSVFQNITYNQYLWSSTTSSWLGGAKRVYTGFGESSNDTKTNGSSYTLAVRGGQPVSDNALLIASPRQADILGIAKTYSIVWNTRNLGGTVKISLSRQGGKADTFETIAETTENDGAFDWTIAGSESVNCVLRVEPVGDPSRASQAGLFRIASVKPESIVKPYQVSVVGGASATFLLKVLALDGTYDLSPEIESWTTSDETVAVVDTSGVFTAVSPGMVTIVATYNGLTVSSRIEVIVPDRLENEPNGSAPEATALGEELWMSAAMADMNDDDFFTIHSTEGQIVRLEVISNAAGLVLPIEIVDAAGSVISSFTVLANGRTRTLLTLSAGTTTVKASSNASGEYLLRYTFLSNGQGGQKIWETAAGGCCSAPTVSGDRVYVGSTDGRLYCKDAQTGARLWEHNTGYAINSSPVVYHDRVYVATHYNLFCIDARNGGRLWSVSLRNNWQENRSSPAIYDGKVYIASRYDDNGEQRGVVQCVDAATGEKLWEYEAAGYIYASPTVADGKVFIGGEYRVSTISYGKLYTLDAATGARLREYLTGSTIQSSAAYGDGVVYVGSNDGKVYAIDAETNQLRWSFQTGSAIGYSSPAIDAERLYIGNESSLVCIDRHTGGELWRQYPGNSQYSSPAVSGGRVYAGGSNNQLYLVDSRYGDIIWSSSTNGTVYSPVVGGGKVYVMSSDGRLRCIDAGDPTADGWQMFMHDAGHSGDARRVSEGLYGISLVSSFDRMLVGGNSATDQLILYGVYLDGSHDVTPEATNWTSSAPEIVTVGSTGKVTALSAGRAVITASYGGYEASIAIDVAALPESAESEPNDASTEAGLLVEGASTYGVQDDVSDVDYYRIEVSDTKTVRIEVLVNGPAPPARMRVTDAWGNQFSQTELSGGTIATAVVELFSGSNYVIVDTVSLAPAGEYLVRYVVLTNPEAGQKLWEYSSGSSLSATPTVMGDSLFIAATGGELQCINRTTGSKAWGYNLGSGCTSSPMVYGGMVFQASQQGKLTAIDVSTGQKVWEFASGGFDWSTPAISGGDLFIGSTDKKLYCIDRVTGDLKWSYETGSPIYSSPMVFDGRVYFGSDDNKVYCLDQATGQVLWSYQTNGAVSSSPALADGLLYVGSNDGEIYCLDPATGTKAWSFRTNGAIGRSSPALADGRVYIGSNDGMTYCLNARTGIKLWETSTGASESSPSVSNGKVYMGGGDSRIYGLDAVSGARIWQYTTAGSVSASPVIADGKVYAASTDGKLYCIDAGDPLADGWQMYRHDLEHRGDASITKAGFSGITLSKTSDHLTFGGTNQQMQLQAYGNYVDGSFAMTEAISAWSSSDEAVAVVSATGMVTAQGPGVATITAGYGGYTGTMAVTVESVQDHREVEPNDTTVAGTGLTGSTIFYGSLESADDRDVFTVNLPEAQKIRIEVLFNQYIQNTDILVSDAEGGELLRFSPSSLVWNSRIVTMPAGVNTISLSSLSGASGEYLLRYTFLSNERGGQKIWEFTAAGGIYSSPSLSGGKVYFSTTNGIVYCVDEDSGKKIWEFRPGVWGSGTSPIVSGNRLYVGVGNSVYCLDADKGIKLWESNISTEAKALALFENDLFITAYNSLVSLDAATGRKNWEQPITDWTSLSAPTVSDGRVYVSTYFYFNSREQGKLYAFDRETGEKIWEKIMDGILHESSPAVVGGKIYVGSRNPGKLYCLDASNGESLWEFSGQDALNSPVVYNEKVFVTTGSWWGVSYCLDARTGALLWQYNMGDDNWSHNAPAISQGKVYLSSRYRESSIYGRIHCVDAETGTLLWRVQTNGVFTHSSPAVENGKVFVGAESGAFYAVDAGDPAAGGWTMFQNDLQHTGDASHSFVGSPRYSVSVKPVSEMESYKFYLIGEYLDGNHTMAATWTLDDPSVAVMDGNTLTALKNGRVTVSTDYEGITYAKTLYLQPDFEGYESLYNDIVEEAALLGDGAFIQGEILLDDVDFYSFSLAEASLVEIAYMSYSETADTRMEILDAGGHLMASAASVDGREMVVSVGLPAGVHYIKLSGSGDIDQNAFYVLTRKVVGTLASKGLVSMNFDDALESSINNLLDQSAFSFSLPQKKAVKIGFSPSSETAGYRIELLDSSEIVIDQIDALFGVPVYFEAVYNTGSYIVRVTPSSKIDAAGSFSVTLEESARMAEEEPNGTCPSATEIATGDSITGRLSHAEDEDFYAFTLDAPSYLDLSFTCPGSYNRYKISVYKESGENLINGMDVPVNKDITLPMGLSIGRYYVKVAGYDTLDVDIIHYYTLSLRSSAHTNLEIESNDTLKFANAIDKNALRMGRVFSSTDLDYYGFYLPVAGYFTISFTPESATADYRISLVNENDETAYQKISTDGEPVLIQVNPLPGNYFVRIEANGELDQYSFYDLVVGTDVADFEILGLKSLVHVGITGTKPEMSVTETQTLTAVASYSDATTEVVSSPIWTSLDETVATVNAAGLVTATGEGVATIVATFGGITGQYAVTVGAAVGAFDQHYGNLVLVAGGGLEATNTLKDATQYLSDLVYRRFKGRLFSDKDIHYINPMTWHDINGDGYDDNIIDDAVPTVAGFESAVTGWAASQNTDGPLYIYLIDHGGIDKFDLFPNQLLTASKLKGLLDTFQSATGRKVVVMIEACKSGSFTDDLASETYERVVVTSTDNQNAYLDLDGKISFTQFFMDNLHAGSSVQSAYFKADTRLDKMGLPYSAMVPQLAESRVTLAGSTFIGGNFAIAGLNPEFSETSPDQTVAANQTHSFYATLSDLEDIERVWAVVVPPGYVPPEVSPDLETPEVTLPTFDLADADADGRYEGSYSDFAWNGVYTITFYAVNANGNVSVSTPVSVTVEGGTSLDSDGDGMPDDWEDQYPGLDKNSADGTSDLDQDGLTNYREYQFGASPVSSDTDQDGMDDNWESCWGFNPTTPDSSADADGDGVSNLVEYQDGTNPIDNTSSKDHIPPGISAVTPVENEVHVNPDTSISVSFNEAMDLGSITINFVKILGSMSGLHQGNLSYSAVDHILTVIPDNLFAYGETITVTISSTLADTEGNCLDGNQNGFAEGSPSDDYEWQFTITEDPGLKPPNPYDANGDWLIGDFELLDAIDAWAEGRMETKIGANCDVDFYLLDLIDLWKGGSYDYNDQTGDPCFTWGTVQ